MRVSLSGFSSAAFRAKTCPWVSGLAENRVRGRGMAPAGGAEDNAAAEMSFNRARIPGPS